MDTNAIVTSVNFQHQQVLRPVPSNSSFHQVTSQNSTVVTIATRLPMPTVHIVSSSACFPEYESPATGLFPSKYNSNLVSLNQMSHPELPYSTNFSQGSLSVNQQNSFKGIMSSHKAGQIGITSPAVDKHMNLIIARHTATTNTSLMNSSLPKTSSTVTADVHEMQQHHFQNTIAKARQMPGIANTVQQSNIPSIQATAHIASNGSGNSQANPNQSLQNIVFASVMAAVNGTGTKNSNSLSLKKPTVKRKKKPKKPPLKLIDTSDKQLQCPQCPRKFSWQFQLHQHLRTHSGERPFICSECRQAYKRKEHLQRHERIHTGERPFECKECGKKYRRRSQLTRHARVHTGERPYVCTICPKAFRRRGHLCRHFKTHANEILKKSGVNETSLKEASALLAVTFPPSLQTKTRNERNSSKSSDETLPIISVED